MNQIEDMHTFVRIVEAGSISKAAEQLDTVKSVVSKRLTALEKRLNVTLITRTTRSQTITESGRSYYDNCIRLLEDLNEVESNLKDKNCALAGKIKISVPFSFGVKHLAPSLRAFNKINPDIHFDVDFNDRKVDLIQEGYDMAIRISTLKDSSLIARKITSVEQVLCASPSYLAKNGKPTSFEDLENGHVRLRYNLASDAWTFTSSTGKHISLRLPCALSANNGDYLCEEAITGRGLLFVPDFICYEAIRSGQLVALLRDHMRENKTHAYAVYPHTKHISFRVRRLIDFLIEYFGEEPYWKL